MSGERKNNNRNREERFWSSSSSPAMIAFDSSKAGTSSPRILSCETDVPRLKATASSAFEAVGSEMVASSSPLPGYATRAISRSAINRRTQPIADNFSTFVNKIEQEQQSQSSESKSSNASSIYRLLGNNGSGGSVSYQKSNMDSAVNRSENYLHILAAQIEHVYHCQTTKNQGSEIIPDQDQMVDILTDVLQRIMRAAIEVKTGQIKALDFAAQLVIEIQALSTFSAGAVYRRSIPLVYAALSDLGVSAVGIYKMELMLKIAQKGVCCSQTVIEWEVANRFRLFTRNHDWIEEYDRLRGEGYIQPMIEQKDRQQLLERSSELQTIAVLRQTTQEELTVLTEKICTLFHADTINQAAQNKRIQEINFTAKEAEKKVSKLLKLDWRSALVNCEWLKDYKSINEDGVLPPQPANPLPQALVEIAEVVQLFFQTTMFEIVKAAKLPPMRLKIGPVKTVERVIAKISEPETLPGQCYDLNRCTIICGSPEEFKAVMERIGYPHFKVLKLKNKFRIEGMEITQPPCLFYQVELLGARPMINGRLALLDGRRWIVEIQVTRKEFDNTKMLSHPVYEITRSGQLPEVCPFCRFI